MANNSGKMTLPTSGSTNWGSQLNGYLEWLNDRISNLSASLANMESNSVGSSGGGIAATGWTSLEKFYLDKATIKIKGYASIGGYNPRENISVDKAFTVSANADPGFYHLVLTFDVENDSFNTELLTSYPGDILHILLGIVEVTKNQNNESTITGFFPYIQTALTTLSQHKYNLDNLWADMDTVTVKVQSDGAVEVRNSYTIKGGYIASFAQKSDIPNNLFYGFPQEKTVHINTLGIKYYQENGKELQLCSSKGKNGSTNIIGRILLDLFGNVVVIYSSFNSTTLSSPAKEEIANRTLYNTQFLSLNDSSLYFSDEKKTPVSNRHFLELCRFGIATNAKDNEYRGFNIGNQNIPTGLFLTKALNQGVMYQQSMNAWVPNTGTVNFSSLNFGCGDNTFKILPKNLQNDSYILYEGMLWDAEELAQVDGESCYIPLWERHKVKRPISLMNSGADNDIVLKSASSIKLLGEDDNSSTVYVGRARFNYKCDANYKASSKFYSNLGLAYLELKEYENDSGAGNVSIPPYGSVVLCGSPNNQDKNCAIKIGGYEESGEVKSAIKILGDNIIVDTYTGDDNSISILLHSSLKFNGTESNSIDCDFDDGDLSYKNVCFKVNENTKICSDKISLLKQEDATALELIYNNDNQTATFGVDIKLNDGKIIQYLSDRRLKENISPLTYSCSDTILNTPIVKYNYLQNEEPQIGIIAQDLESALPENAFVFVKQSNQRGFEDCRSIAETKLVYILWKGLQEEIQARKELERKLEELIGDK